MGSVYRWWTGTRALARRRRGIRQPSRLVLLEEPDDFVEDVFRIAAGQFPSHELPLWLVSKRGYCMVNSRGSQKLERFAGRAFSLAAFFQGDGSSPGGSVLGSDRSHFGLLVEYVVWNREFQLQRVGIDVTPPQLAAGDQCPSRTPCQSDRARGHPQGSDKAIEGAAPGPSGISPKSRSFAPPSMGASRETQPAQCRLERGGPGWDSSNRTWPFSRKRSIAQLGGDVEALLDDDE